MPKDVVVGIIKNYRHGLISFGEAMVNLCRYCVDFDDIQSREYVAEVAWDWGFVIPENTIYEGVVYHG